MADDIEKQPLLAEANWANLTRVVLKRFGVEGLGLSAKPLFRSVFTTTSSLCFFWGSSISYSGTLIGGLRSKQLVQQQSKLLPNLCTVRQAAGVSGTIPLFRLHVGAVE